MTRPIAAFSVIILASAAWSTAGPVYNFDRITNTNVENLGGQLSVEVTDAGVVSGVQRVDFVFRNNVGTASSICDVYFQDGTLLGIASISGTAGVAFSQGASPGNLPAGNTLAVPFVTTAGFLTDSDPPVMSNGINSASESLTIRFNLINGKTYADTLAAIAQGTGAGGLRIGLHVQAIGAAGGSDSYVSTTPVPLPAAAWMGMTLMGGVGGVGYFRKRRTLVNLAG